MGGGASTVAAGVVAAQLGADEPATKFLEDALGGFRQLLDAAATAWVGLPTPSLDAGVNTMAQEAPTALPAEVIELLGYVSWIALAVAVLAIIVVGARMALAWRSGEGASHLGRLGWVLVAIALASGAGGIVAAVLPGVASRGGTDAVGAIQFQLFPWMAGLAILSILLGAIKIMWTQRGQEVGALARSIGTLILVSAGAVVVTTALSSAFDQLSLQVMRDATGCGFGGDEAGPCLGDALAELTLGAAAADANAAGLSGAVGTILALVMVLALSLVTLVQLAFMVFRTLLIVILVGALPLASSFTNTDLGRQWFSRTLGWLIAALLYKPVASLALAAGLRIFSEWNADPGRIVWAMLVGIAVIGLCVAALPALMRLCVPAVARVTGRTDGAGVSASAVSVAAGAIDLTGVGERAARLRRADQAAPLGASDVALHPAAAAGRSVPGTTTNGTSSTAGHVSAAVAHVTRDASATEAPAEGAAAAMPGAASAGGTGGRVGGGTVLGGPGRDTPGQAHGSNDDRGRERA